jgi:signal transduction histidine kinase
MHGNVGATSKPGQGSVFTVQLPLAVAKEKGVRR